VLHSRGESATVEIHEIIVRGIKKIVIFVFYEY